MLKIVKEHLAVFTGLGIVISAAFGAGVSWAFLNGRVTSLETKVKNLSTPQSARAKICEKLMDAWIAQTGSSFSNGKMDFEKQLEAYDCVGLAVAPSPASAVDKAAVTK